MFKQFIAIMAFAAVFASAQSRAADRPLAVVEMFTSQGCSSCPPADAVLLDLSRRKDIVALGFHVDYWDYLGWKDTLGSRAYSDRQHNYARSFGNRTVYTPQAVLNGRVHVNGAEPRLIDEALADLVRSEGGLRVDIAIEMTVNSVVIQTGAAEGQADEAHLVLVYFDDETPVTIERGENHGKTITYANVVTDIRTVGMWHGEPERYELPKSEMTRHGHGGCAVLLQSVSPDGLPGAIIGAAIVR